MRPNGSSAPAKKASRRDKEDRSERRWSERFAHCAVGTIFYQGSRYSTTCYVANVSSSGARIELDPDDWVNPFTTSRSLPGSFKLVVHALSLEADCNVIWRDKSAVGVRFVGRLRQMPRQFRRLRAF